MEGRLIGQYRVTGVLGEGGMGVVYAAEHTLLNRSAAVKVLLPRFSGEQEVVTRFFNEARATTAIQHPGIVEIFDFGWTAEGAAFIVMEHLRGESLRARYKRGPMRWSTALALTRQIAGALGAAHAKGIVHRDLKPDNVFLVPDPEVPGGERIKLLDFGIAKLAGALSSHHKTQTGALMGTPTYMAPEQCRGVAVDARADLYSLGCMLFELCTGRPPFVGEGAGDVLAAHIYLPPPTMASLVGGVPQELEALVQRLLAKAPVDRVQTAGELIRLIDAARAAIRQATRSGPLAVPTLGSSSLDGSTGDDHSEPVDEDGPTEREPLRPQDTRQDAAGPALATEAQNEAAIPAAPAISMASQLDTTLSSATGTRPRAQTRAPARHSAVLGGVGGLAILGAIAVSFALVRGGGSGGAPIQSASSSPSTESAASAVTPPALKVMPLGPTVTPLEPEAAPPTATPPAPPEPAASPSSSAGPKSTQSDAPPSTPPSLPARTNAPQAPARSSQSQATEVTISIQSVPSGAVISRGDVFLGVTPQDVQLERGDYEFKFELVLPGYYTYVLPVRPISTLRKIVKLKQLPPRQPPPSSSPLSLPSPQPTSSAVPAPPQPTPPINKSSPTPQSQQEHRGINPF